jgi:hypothetical protein
MRREGTHFYWAFKGYVAAVLLTIAFGVDALMTRLT